MRFALIRSPFVGCVSWEAVRERLPDAVVARYEINEGKGWYANVAREIVDQVDEQPWIAVLHSSAGSLAPALSAAASKLRGVVFIDAILPHPGQSIADRAPPAQIRALRRGASNGLLARWDEWLKPGSLEEWIPDAAVRAGLLNDLPLVPIDILDAASPDYAGWAKLPGSYVQLSDGFESFAQRAEALGWSVHRHASHHLAMLTEADAIAELLLRAL